MNNNYMIPTPKYQYPRKPRKPFSRDKKDFGLFHGSGRQKSRQSEERRPHFQNSPAKPNQLISNLRFQLTHLRQEVAKLSRKDHKKSTPTNEIKLQYEPRSPREGKEANSYYFDEAKNTLPEEQLTERIKTSSNSRDGKIRGQERNQELLKLKQQIAQIQAQNNELAQANQQLNNRMKEISGRLKRQYEMKIQQIEGQKDRTRRQRENEENDRTINYQKQVLQNKNLIEELRKQVKDLTSENQVLKIKAIQNDNLQADISRKDLLILEKDQLIQQLSIQLKNLQITIKAMQEQKQNYSRIEDESKHLQKDIKLKTIYIQDLKSNIEELNRKNSQQEKRIIKLSQRSQIEPEKGRKLKPLKESQEVKQLQQIIIMHEKSLSNQQSDINYLEGEVRKLSFFKNLSKNQFILIESLNEEIAVLSLKGLNSKYKL